MSYQLPTGISYQPLYSNWNVCFFNSFHSSRRRSKYGLESSNKTVMGMEKIWNQLVKRWLKQQKLHVYG